MRKKHVQMRKMGKVQVASFFKVLPTAVVWQWDYTCA